MRLIVTTHGETIENLEGLLQGQRPGILSPRGIEQANQVSAYLGKRRIDEIYTSQMDRCVKTAKIIAASHPEASFRVDKRLNARSLGLFEGMKKSDVPWSTLDGDFYTNKPECGESLPEVWERLKAFYDGLRIMPAETTLLAVAHGESAVLLGGMVQGCSLPQSYDLIKEPRKAEISEYEINDRGQNRVIVSNYAGHLI